MLKEQRKSEGHRHRGPTAVLATGEVESLTACNAASTSFGFDIRIAARSGGSAADTGVVVVSEEEYCVSDKEKVITEIKLFKKMPALPMLASDVTYTFNC
jgi:hypothetical protein